MTNPAPLTNDQQTALGLTGSMKIIQKATLVKLRADAKAARKAKDFERANALSRKAIALSQQNLALHRAKQKALKKADLGQINQRAMKVVKEANATIKGIEDTTETLKRAAEVIALIRRFVDVFT